jgi:hypothetical protein
MNEVLEWLFENEGAKIQICKIRSRSGLFRNKLNENLLRNSPELLYNPGRGSCPRARSG